MAIGVSQSSLKRWADEGLIKATRTAGGHRRIALTEAIRFVRENRSPVLRADLLGLPEVDGAPWAAKSDGSIDDGLYNALVAGDSSRARGLLIARYLAGDALPAIFDGPIARAMTRLGELWRHDDKGIFLEHRATDICISAVNQIRLLTPPRAASAPVALGGALEDDPYLLPSMMAAAVLGEAGFNDMNLGPLTPIDSLIRAAEECRPRLVWVSLSIARDEHAARARAELRRLAARLTPHATPLVIGGRGVGDPAQHRRPNVHVVGSMAELAAFARGLLTATTTAL